MFPKEDTLRFARACQAAYSESGGVKFAAAHGMEHVKIAHVQQRKFNNVTFAAMHVDAPERRLIAFRGTVDKEDWKKDLDALPSEHDEWPMLVHSGFADVTLRLWAQLQPIPTDKPIDVSGHSLGAAVSCLFMRLLYQRGYPIGQRISFGEPRSMIAAPIAPFPELRVVNAGDPVPSVPPPPYEHVGKLAWLKGGQVYDQMSWWEDLKRMVSWHSLDDHQIQSYIDALTATEA